jgi:hypothetical protein
MNNFIIKLILTAFCLSFAFELFPETYAMTQNSLVFSQNKNREFKQGSDQRKPRKKKRHNGKRHHHNKKHHGHHHRHM